MQIEVLSTSVEDRGKYKQLEVAYKGGDGKVSSKKIMSFAAPDVFKILSNSKQGDTFSVTTVKNDKGYWEWTAANTGGEVVGTKSAAGVSPRSTYETPEERANRQVLIVRQSSVSNACEFFKLNPKKSPSVQEVLEVAKTFENYVFGKTSSATGVEALQAMEDDIPV